MGEDMGNGKKRKSRAGKNPTIEQAKLKEMLDKLKVDAPAEQLKQLLLEQRVTNERLHVTNKVLTQTLKEMLGEFHERLAALEMQQFGEVRGDFEKYLAKESADVQLQDVREVDGVSSDDAEDREAGDGRGQGDESDEAGSEGGDSTLH